MTLVEVETQEILDIWFVGQTPNDMLLILMVIGAFLFIMTRKPEIYGAYLMIIGAYFLIPMVIAYMFGGASTLTYFPVGLALGFIGYIFVHQKDTTDKVASAFGKKW